MNARTADFAATAPWTGITGKPDAFPATPNSLTSGGASDNSVLVWSGAQGKWVPLTLAQLKQRLDALP